MAKKSYEIYNPDISEKKYIKEIEKEKKEEKSPPDFKEIEEEFKPKQKEMPRKPVFFEFEPEVKPETKKENVLDLDKEKIADEIVIKTDMGDVIVRSRASEEDKENEEVPIKKEPSKKFQGHYIKTGEGEIIIKIKKNEFETGADNFLSEINKKGKIKLKEFAKENNYDYKTVEDWAMILDDGDLIELKYPFIGSAFAVPKFKRISEKHEEKLNKKKKKQTRKKEKTKKTEKLKQKKKKKSKKRSKHNGVAL